MWGCLPYCSCINALGFLKPMFRILNMPEPKKSEGLYAAVTKGAQFCVFKPENVRFMKKLTEILIGKMLKTFYQRKSNYIL